MPGHGLRLGYYAQEHDTLDTDRTVLENMRTLEPRPARGRRPGGCSGSFLFTGDVVHQQAGTLSGGEKTRLALATLVVSGANVLLLDEPTNNLDPASREEVLSALATYKGAVVLVTHDEGAVTALQPEKVLMLPDGVEDQWSDDLADLVVPGLSAGAAGCSTGKRLLATGVLTEASLASAVVRARRRAGRRGAAHLAGLPRAPGHQPGRAAARRGPPRCSSST